MLNKEETAYYDRHIRLDEIGIAGQESLKSSRVLIVGMGGLGCPVGQYLAAAGVGTLTLIDPDNVSVTNLHRQVLFGIEDVGQGKVLVASKKLAGLNPHIKLNPLQIAFSIQNARRLVADHDIVIDCTDNFATRYLINDACVLEGKPFIYGAISKFSGQVSVFNLHDGPTYRCLFPEYPDPAMHPACGEVGVLGVLPGLIGTIQGVECIKLITGIGKPLSGKILMVDTKNMAFKTFNIKVNPASREVTTLVDYRATCTVLGEDISWQEWHHTETSDQRLILDVRSEEEHMGFNLGGVLIPLDELSSRFGELPLDASILVYCKSGVRSAVARDFLLDKGFKEVKSLRGGIESIR